MDDFSLISHLSGAGAYLVLIALLLFSWQRNRTEGLMLMAAGVLSLAWLSMISYQHQTTLDLIGFIRGLEILRDLAWFTFFLRLLGYRWTDGLAGESPVPRFAVAVYLLSGLLIGSVVAEPYLSSDSIGLGVSFDLSILGTVMLSVFGLVLVEQLYRNTDPESRWNIKFLCLGVGGMFAYDFYMYSDALLFGRVEKELWVARGMINAIVVPFIAISASRNADWSVKIFASKRIVFHSATLLGAGAYLILMAVAGYYIRDYGGTWGIALQTVFLFGALVLLLVLLFSGQVRARLKFFLNKHFFHYKYDYREEWLRFIQTLSSADDGEQTRINIIRAVAEIVESPGGILWVKSGDRYFEPVARYSFPEPSTSQESSNGALAAFLRKREWVVDISEIDSEPELYSGLHLPAWLAELPTAWLIVPLLHKDELVGFIVLARSRGNFIFNWEDIDLLKTVGKQAAGYLRLLMVNEALAEARQFEAFSRLSAYVVHDLKNMVAQLSLVVSNAKRHMHNPEFINDAMHTVDNTVVRMNRLLDQLRKDRHTLNEAKRVELCSVIQDVVELRKAQIPVPTFSCPAQDIFIVSDRDRLAAVMEHLIQNAQDACDDEGKVSIAVSTDASQVIINIEDNGTGMDASFIRERLYRPFDTTKGNAGMGVGVYESREFVRNQGGEISVVSSLGHGTTFSIKLPIYADKSATELEPTLIENLG